jgi:hypothetical protein
MRLNPAPRGRAREKQRQLALALCAAPLVIGWPLIAEAIRDPAMLAVQWDSWLIFVVLPCAASAFLCWSMKR